MNDYKINTKCIQSGYTPKNGEARVLPINLSTTFKYDSCEEMGDLLDLKKAGYFYSRLSNPTCDAVASKIADLEGGIGAILTSSGMSAVFYSVFNICGAGDHIVSSSAIYGGSFNLFSVTLKKMGIDVTFIDPDSDYDTICAAVKDNTKLVFGETLSNPSLDVLDIEVFAKAAHDNGIPLIVDNTFPTPINCRPIEFGADIVVHSTTKYMDGHASTVGGVVVDGGRFNWEQNDKFKCLSTPDESYHGIIYTKQFGNAAYLNKLVAQVMRDLGSMQSPLNAFIINISLESLFLRVPRHCENARKVAEFLNNNDKVSWIEYPDLPDDKNHALASKYLPNGSSGVISFGVKGGRNASIKVMDSLKMIAIVTHVADARTCVLHPASTTHRQLTDQQLIDCGVKPDMIRLSVGIEDCDDIIKDLSQALENV